MTEEVASPCISVCSVDESTGLCIGCFRSLDEIRGWWDLDNQSKQKIVDKAEHRQLSAFE